MASNIPQLNTNQKVTAAIGHICLQWSLLETAILAVISAIEALPTNKVFLLFGGLDMKPRLRIALNLARQPGIPSVFAKRLKAVQKALDDGLDEERHQAVHGVHFYPSDVPDKVRITMTRWHEPKRTQDKSAHDLFLTGAKISDLAMEVFSIFDDFGEWKFGKRDPSDDNSQLTQAETSSRLKLTQHVKNRLHHLWRRLRWN